MIEDFNLFVFVLSFHTIFCLFVFFAEWSHQCGSVVIKKNFGIAHNIGTIYIMGGIVYTRGQKKESCDTIVFDFGPPSTWRHEAETTEKYKPQYYFSCVTWHNSIYALTFQLRFLALF
jgi:hypothetical protein